MDVLDNVSTLRRSSPPGGLSMGKTRVMTPKEFLKLSAEERARVLRTEVIPPRLGRSGFGMIRVTLR